MEITQNLIRNLSSGMCDIAEAILQEFRIRTPGYDNVHVTLDIPFHEHAEDRPPYTQQLVEGWKFTSAASSSALGGYSIGSVYNATPYAEYVEYGWRTKKGKLVPGHFMEQNAIRIGNVMSLYAAVAHKALVVSLAQADWNQGLNIRVSRGRENLSGGAISRGDGVGVCWRRGRVQVSGGGQGVGSDVYARIAMNLGDAMAAALNG